MKAANAKRVYLILALVFHAGGALAQATSPIPSPSRTQTQLATLQAELDAVLSVAGLQNGGTSGKPVIEVSSDSRYPMASIAGQPARIVVSLNYLERISSSALRFALAHELAHLRLEHHARLHSVRQTGLAAERIQTSTRRSVEVKSVMHTMEYEADRLAMQWCKQLGCDRNSALEALKAAYGGREEGGASHPALADRMHMIID